MRTPRRLALILAISLGLNLFLGGIVATHVFWRGEQWRMGSPGGAKMSRHMFHRRAAAATLEGEHRRMADDIWQRGRDGHHRYFKAMRQSREDIRRLLIADEFDRNALATAYVSLNQQLSSARSGLGETIAQIAERLPPDARKRYFEAGFRKSDRRHFRRPPPHE